MQRHDNPLEPLWTESPSLKSIKRWIMVWITLIIVFSGVYVVRNWNYCIDGERDTYFRLPSNAQEIEEHSVTHSRSCTHWIRFEIPPTDLNSFVTTTFIQTPLSSQTLPERWWDFDHLQEVTGWGLSNITSYLGGEAGGTMGRHLDYQIIFVDTTNPSHYIVYLVTNKNWL
jgi:hypothetical protein